jgi:hypothetical protein
MSDIEKNPTLVGDSSSLPPSDKQLQVNDEEIYIDPVAEKKLLRKCDTFLVPLLTIAFLSAYLDRSNIGNAAISGLLPDLGMSSQQLASESI